MEHLAAYLRQQRQTRGYDVRTLVGKSGVTNAQISRIETGKSQISVEALVRLAYGLGVGLQDVLEALRENPDDIYATTLQIIHSRATKKQAEQAIPTASDVYALVMFHRDRPEQIEELLAAGSSAMRMGTKHSDERDILGEIYQTGGVITLADLAESIRVVREQMQKSLRQISSERISYSTIGRFERGRMERILVSQIMDVDALFGYQGLLLASSWEAEEYESGIAIHRAVREWDWLEGWNPAEKQVAAKFIAICRWHHLDNGNQGWWRNVRQMLEGYLS